MSEVETTTEDVAGEESTTQIEARQGESGLERLSRMGKSGELVKSAEKLIADETAEKHANFPSGIDGKTRAELERENEPLEKQNARLQAEILETDRKLRPDRYDADGNKRTERTDLVDDRELGRVVRERIEAQARAQWLEERVDSFVEDYDSLVGIEEDADGYAVGEPGVTPQLVDRLTDLISSGATPEMIEEVAESTDPDLVYELVNALGVQAAENARQEAIREHYAPVIEKVNEFERLAGLNPGLADEARGYFGEMDADDADPLVAFRMVAARRNAEERDQATYRRNVQLFADGDERYFLQEYLPQLERSDPVAFARLTRAEEINPAEIFPEADFSDPEIEGTEAWLVERLKADPQGVIQRAKELMRGEAPREHSQENVAAMMRRAEEANLRESRR